MVLWEIALGTAYFLGLKRTHKLALRIQRKLISPKHPKVREFVQRRTRIVFNAALRVHLKIEEIKNGVRNNVSNRILDRMKSSAQTKGPSGGNAYTTSIFTRQISNYSATQGGLPNLRGKSEHLFISARNMLPRTFSPITMMRPAGSNFQYKQYSTGGANLFTLNRGAFGFGEVVRNDIRQYFLHHH